MMNLDNYYLHSTGGFRGIHNKDNRIIDILKEGRITTNKERDSLGDSSQSPNESICLCDFKLYKPTTYALSSYEDFVLCDPSLLISRDIKVFMPTYDENSVREKETHSDMIDEVRHKGNISLDLLQCITFPIYGEREIYMVKSYNDYFPLHLKINRLKIFVENISWIEDNIIIPILDIYTGKKINKNDASKELERCKSLMR